jgi:ElaB/YqjD/DUF883 family membrane-anchored ribosome-binding protein
MMEKIPTQTGARDQLLADLKTVIQDAEAWLRHGGSLTGEELKAAKAKFESAHHQRQGRPGQPGSRREIEGRRQGHRRLRQGKSVEGGRHRRRRRRRAGHADQPSLMALLETAAGSGRPRRHGAHAPGTGRRRRQRGSALAAGLPAPGRCWPPSSAPVALMLVALFVIVLFWDEHRLLAVGGMAGLFALAALRSCEGACRLAARGPMLAATRAELGKDIAFIKGTGARMHMNSERHRWPCAART